MLTTILSAVLVLGVLILVHELGHFWAAKAVDIEVPRFSIGLGPKAFGFRRGETEYVVSWLPLGGYVKMAGMGDEEAVEMLEGEATPEDREPSDRDFDAKPIWARAMVISAGVIMNFLFAVAAFAVIAGVWGVPEQVEARLGEVVEEALPAGTYDLAALPRGVRVSSVGDRSVETMEDLQRGLLLAGSEPTTLSFDGAPDLTLTVPESDSARSSLVQALRPVLPVPPVIGEVVEGGPADSAGVQTGDRILAVDGRSVETWQEFKRAIEERPGETLELRVRRAGAETTLAVRPAERRAEAAGDTLVYGRIEAGVDEGEMAAATASMGRRPIGPIASVGHGFQESVNWTVFTVEIVRDLITGDVARSNLAGPVRIVEFSGEMARAGVLALLRFMAILSINLAILNLLPIPVLDGGHLVFLGLEAVRGEAVSVETRVRWTQLGMLVVAAIMVWAIGNDLLHLFGG